MNSKTFPKKCINYIKKFASIDSLKCYAYIILLDLLYLWYNKECTITDGNEKQCGDQFWRTLFFRVMKCILWNILYILVLHKIIFNKNVPILIALIYIPNFHYIFTDWSITPFKYGKITNYLTYVFFFVGLLLYVICLITHKAYGKSERYCWLSVGVNFLALWALVSIWKIGSCNDWDYGIFNKVEQLDTLCELLYPDVCYYKLTNGWFDFSRY